MLLGIFEDTTVLELTRSEAFSVSPSIMTCSTVSGETATPQVIYSEIGVECCKRVPLSLHKLRETRQCQLSL